MILTSIIQYKDWKPRKPTTTIQTRKAFDMNYDSMRDGRRPYPCKYCGLQCNTKTTKNKHIHTMHEKEIRRY
jgi:hypothetical protein